MTTRCPSQYPRRRRDDDHAELGERVVGWLRAENFGPKHVRYRNIVYYAMSRAERNELRKQQGLSGRSHKSALKPLSETDAAWRVEDRRDRACTGKKHFKSFRIAAAFAREVAPRVGRLMKPYRCEFCGDIHVGGRARPNDRIMQGVSA